MGLWLRGWKLIISSDESDSESLGAGSECENEGGCEDEGEGLILLVGGSGGDCTDMLVTIRLYVLIVVTIHYDCLEVCDACIIW